MVRPHRLELPGALYRINACGDERDDIYFRDGERRVLLGVLGNLPGSTKSSEARSRQKERPDTLAFPRNMFVCVTASVRAPLKAWLKPASASKK